VFSIFIFRGIFLKLLYLSYEEKKNQLHAPFVKRILERNDDEELVRRDSDDELFVRDDDDLFERFYDDLD
jgi:hypothetical protein